MEKYEDFVKACAALLVESANIISLCKRDDGLAYNVYFGEDLLSYGTLYKGDSVIVLKAKYAGLKAMCESLNTSGQNDDRQTA